MDRLAEFFEPAMHRLPVLGELGMRTIINGPIPISPDGEPIMGPGPVRAAPLTTTAISGVP